MGTNSSEQILTCIVWALVAATFFYYRHVGIKEHQADRNLGSPNPRRVRASEPRPGIDDL